MAKLDLEGRFRFDSDPNRDNDGLKTGLYFAICLLMFVVMWHDSHLPQQSIQMVTQMLHGLAHK